MDPGRIVVPGQSPMFWYPASENEDTVDVRIGFQGHMQNTSVAGMRCKACGTLLLSGQADTDSSSWWND